MSANVNFETDTSMHKRPENFITKLADNIAGATNVRTVYGEPIERDGITIIPVARVSWGIGGGFGRGSGRPAKEGEGSGGGGGGGATVSPIGYIEVKDGVAKYRAIPDPALLIRIILCSGLVVALILNRVRKIVQVARS
jgi:uncharacterized spore protein YtfJ